MTPNPLLDHFDRISDAPDAIPCLRRFILDLAVRGKLVEQNRNDEPATELLKQIQGKNAPRVKQVATTMEKSFGVIKDTEIPFARPASWQWVRLGECLEMINGRAFKPTDWQAAGLPIVRIQNLNREDAPFNYCDESQVEERHIVDSQSFLISWSGTPGTSFGAFIWGRGKAALNQHIFKCIQIGAVYFDRFLQVAINGRLDEMIARAHGGVGLQHITKGKLENLVLPLPPLAEQHRIVAKVDELMALCDRLEATQTELENRRDKVAAASLHRLNNGADADEFRAHARFHLRHLSRLTTRPEHIQQLRQTILNLAVRGKLVSQNPRDEPIGKLLNRISIEQSVLLKEGLLKNRVISSDLQNADHPHNIPSDWRWMRLAELISFGPQNGVSPKETKNDKAPKALTLTATTSAFFNSTHYKYVDLRESDCQSYWLSTGDVLFQRGNTREYVGIAAVFDGPERTFVFPDLMIRVRFSNSLDLRYIHTTLISPPLRNYFSSQATGASSTMPKISQGILLNTPIPVPPLAEQQRIVAKVDELIALCNRLEAQLNTTQSESWHLLEAVLHDALYSGKALAKQEETCLLS